MILTFFSYNMENSAMHRTLLLFVSIILLFRTYSVSTRRCFDVHTMFITLKRRRMDLKTTSCAYWVKHKIAPKIDNFIFKTYTLSVYQLVSDIYCVIVN